MQSYKKFSSLFAIPVLLCSCSTTKDDYSLARKYCQATTSRNPMFLQTAPTQDQQGPFNVPDFPPISDSSFADCMNEKWSPDNLTESELEFLRELEPTE